MQTSGPGFTNLLLERTSLSKGMGVFFLIVMEGGIAKLSFIIGRRNSSKSSNLGGLYLKEAL